MEKKAQAPLAEEELEPPAAADSDDENVVDEILRPFIEDVEPTKATGQQYTFLHLCKGMVGKLIRTEPAFKHWPDAVRPCCSIPEDERSRTGTMCAHVFREWLTNRMRSDEEEWDWGNAATERHP